MPDMQVIREILEETGYGVTILPDPAAPGGFFADIRWANGRLAQTGNGATQDEALRQACIRLMREPMNRPAEQKIVAEEIYDAGYRTGQGSCGDKAPAALGGYRCSLDTGHEGEHEHAGCTWYAGCAIT